MIATKRRVTLRDLAVRGEFDYFTPGIYNPTREIRARYIEALADYRCQVCGGPVHACFWHRREQGCTEYKVVAICDDWLCNHSELV